MRNLDQVTFPNPTEFYNSRDSKDFLSQIFVPISTLEDVYPQKEQKVLCGLSTASRMLFGSRQHVFSSWVTGAESA